jgi:hypothetical protein
LWVYQVVLLSDFVPLSGLDGVEEDVSPEALELADEDESEEELDSAGDIAFEAPLPFFA